ncbi:MAG: hypothetical protein NTY09_06755 [bacterium]|nr:hypothetical protein [bacterium]
MANREKSRTTSTIWAIGINLVVFAILWYVFGAIPAPARTIPIPVIADNGPGESFGQYTHLIGDAPVDSTAGVEGISAVQPEGNISANSDTDIPPDVADVIPPAAMNDIPPTTGPPELVTPGVWIDEFYLDRGPGLSLSPRLNPDGTFREHPYNSEREKAPTYEDQRTQFPPEELNWPVMTPERFSKLDLPEELRDYNLVLTVQVHLDARGNLLSEPVIVRSSGYPLVDQLTIQKIKDEASFTNASLIATGEPVSLQFHLTVFWDYPVPY